MSSTIRVVQGGTPINTALHFNIFLCLLYWIFFCLVNRKSSSSTQFHFFCVMLVNWNELSWLEIIKWNPIDGGWICNIIPPLLHRLNDLDLMFSFGWLIRRNDEWILNSISCFWINSGSQIIYFSMWLVCFIEAMNH